VKTFAFFALAALLLNTLLGIFVCAVNPRRRANRAFLMASCIFSLWLICLAPGAWAPDKYILMFWIRMSTATSAFIPFAFDYLMMSIACQDQTFQDVLRRLRPWLVLLATVVLIAVMPSFVLDVPYGENILAQPTYGPGRFAYLLFWLVSLGLLFRRGHHYLKTAQGVERAELQFSLLAAGAATLFGVSCAHLFSLIAGSSAAMPFAPLAVVVMDGIIAYGIVTRRIMRVSDLLGRLVAYAMLATYLVFLYTLIFWAVFSALSCFTHRADMVAHIAAALVVAFSLAPTHGRMQKVADHLFVNLQGVNVPRMLRESNQVISTITTLDQLMERFSQILLKATGAERVAVLLLDEGVFRQVYPAPATGEAAVVLNADQALMKVLRSESGPLALDMVTRRRSSPMMQKAAEDMISLKASVALGIRFKNSVHGVLLIGPRRSGRIYGSIEMEGFQLACSHLGLAIENARLYTNIQNDKIYNEILLDSLTSGVVAIDSDGRVTVFNREAQRVTGLPASSVLNHPYNLLPQPLPTVLEQTRREDRRGLWDGDAVISPAPGDSVPIRMSSSVFAGQGGTQGALVVFTDMTLMKKLEDHVRRSDRLASLGTLSAGMAHEIKNPLVALRTFTQLLPERYNDAEFRETFSRLVGEEIMRIDSIVNRLLSFAKPPQPTLRDIRLHAVLDRALQLMQEQLGRKGIRIARQYDTDNDRIRGDEEMLRQAFVNFFLNSMEAMEGGGELTVTTSATGPGWAELPGRVDSASGRLRVSICDSGSGIAQEDLPRVFDPFFTTKNHGTGLGLAVSHGILLEHGASVDVESSVGRGTTFHIQFPLIGLEVAS
jgi:PAS domain S-box-containing protein